MPIHKVMGCNSHEFYSEYLVYDLTLTYYAHKMKNTEKNEEFPYSYPSIFSYS